MSDLNTQDHRIVGVLSRLEAVVDAENAAIGQDPDFDVSRSNSIKSRCLYEMTMLFNGIRPDDLEPEHKQHLETVREKLKINNIKVKAHMEAVRDIAEMIKETVAAWEADGTYSEDQFRASRLS
ncbi:MULTISPECIES: hypothetical protein [Hoeflea]|jgi:hypothetical protein|uniref:Flagellar protein FlgN n=1 Tax=Hoeflea alexandrii TaxID=288436 RepID=A0ABT1CZP2_9HYPH|nr:MULTISPECIES: hypothetical protein [Hoeflea]MCO6410766.1 hypothetical protein [Hoeflea alexandrii]MCY0152122.1 hypothetical protein [Hoeflea alexandrii]VVT25409.1 conserved hypothetical protein [Hoeflea sp. EC-HK425]|tara:strand:+ start:1442 stop:1813 length:372 start_codon:yes stop_codon:yes gene_type:complete